MIKRAKQLWGQVGADDFLHDIERFIERAGGDDSVIARMRALQMGALADAWLDSRITEAISGEQCHRLFGTGELRALAAKLDLPPRDLVRHLTRTLPRIIGRYARPSEGAAGPRRNSRGLWPVRRLKNRQK